MPCNPLLKSLVPPLHVSQTGDHAIIFTRGREGLHSTALCQVPPYVLSHLILTMTA